jgi:hypothetical protein
MAKYTSKNAEAIQSNLNAIAEAKKAEAEKQSSSQEENIENKEKEQQTPPPPPKEEEKPEKKETDKVVTEENKFDYTKISDEDFFKLSSERLKREIKSQDDFFVEKQVEVEKVVEKETDYASDFAKNYDKFFKETKGTVEEFNFVQEDFDAKSDEEIVRANLRNKYHSILDENEINSKYEEMFKIDSEYDDESTINRKNIALKTEAYEARQKLKELQEKYKLPREEKQVETFDADAFIKQEQAKQNEALSNWREAVVNETQEFNGINLNIAEDVSFEFKATDEMKSKTLDTVSDGTFNNLLNPYRKEDGKIDVVSLNKDIFRMQNFDAILESSIKQAIEYGKELEAKKKVNPNSIDRDKGSDAPEKLSKADAFRKQMLERAQFGRRN